MRFKQYFIFITLCLASSISMAITIDIEKGEEAAQPILIVPFATDNTDADMTSVIANDLSLSGRFAPVSPSKMPALPKTESEVVFDDWKALAGTMIVGSLSKKDKTIVMKVELLNVYDKENIATYDYTLEDDSPKTIRKVGHKISDLIYEKLTGERGFFSTKIAYVTFSKEGDNKSYTLDISGVDGMDAQTVFRSSKSILSPSWAPNGKKLAFVSFENNKAEIWVKDLVSGKRSRITNFSGNSSAPSWSPDGSKFAVTLTKDGNPEIYIVSLSGDISRLTNHSGADTEATWAPDSNAVYYLSDRGGQAQIYYQVLNEKEATKITTIGGYNASPDVSDDGSSMVMLHKLDSKYVVAVQDLSNGEVSVVSQTDSDESPSFAPNSDMIVYASQDKGRGVITITNKLGTVHRVYSSSSRDIREPEWSPYFN